MVYNDAGKKSRAKNIFQKIFFLHSVFTVGFLPRKMAVFSRVVFDSYASTRFFIAAWFFSPVFFAADFFSSRPRLVLAFSFFVRVLSAPFARMAVLASCPTRGPAFLVAGAFGSA
jgi:hypothetical protein